MSYNLIVNLNSIMPNTGLTDSGDVINAFIECSNVMLIILLHNNNLSQTVEKPTKANFVPH